MKKILVTILTITIKKKKTNQFINDNNNLQKIKSFSMILSTATSTSTKTSTMVISTILISKKQNIKFDERITTKRDIQQHHLLLWSTSSLRHEVLEHFIISKELRKNSTKKKIIQSLSQCCMSKKDLQIFQFVVFEWHFLWMPKKSCQVQNTVVVGATWLWARIVKMFEKWSKRKRRKPELIIVKIWMKGTLRREKVMAHSDVWVLARRCEGECSSRGVKGMVHSEKWKWNLYLEL